MKKSLLLITALALFATISFAQSVILDFEEANTTTDFQFFGGNLEGVLSQNIANPNPTGINTSATVLEFKKSSDAPVWGGGFSNPDPSIPVDLTNSDEICVDYHTDQAGNLTLKLENSGTTGNWIQSQDVTGTGEWVTVCFDVTQASFEAPFEVAAGNVFPRIVFFLDFGMEGTGTEKVAYIDNIVVPGDVASEGNITFSVNMSEYTETFTQVYVSGGFNGWNGTDNPLTDMGNGVWSGTILMPAGPQQYKFTLDDWAVQEEFMGGEPCTTTDGAYTNRLVEVNGDDSTPVYCWNECAGCITGTNNLVFDENLFTITPTLATDITTVFFDENATGNRTLRLINTLGETVQAFDLGEYALNHELDLNNLASGIYFVNVQIDKKMATKRIVVK